MPPHAGNNPTLCDKPININYVTLNALLSPPLSPPIYNTQVPPTLSAGEDVRWIPEAGYKESIKSDICTVTVAAKGIAGIEP